MMFLAAKVSDTSFYSCGNLNFEFSGTIPNVISTVVLLIKIIVPILLIIFGMLDLGKSVVASKEDEIKKGQQLFIKRIIAAVIVFFVIQIVQIIVKFASGNDDENILACFNCFIHGEVKENACKLEL